MANRGRGTWSVEQWYWAWAESVILGVLVVAASWAIASGGDTRAIAIVAASIGAAIIWSWSLFARFLHVEGWTIEAPDHTADRA